MAGKKSREEFARAKAVLLAGGFTNSGALEVLCVRHGLRDRFAEAALQGSLAGEAAYPLDSEALSNTERAVWAYAQADAMLKARITDNGDDNAD